MYLRRFTWNSGFGGLRRGCSLITMLLDHLIAHGPHFQESLCFLVQALAVVAVKCRFPKDAENSFGTEVILVVKAMHRAQNLIRGKPRILNVRELMATLIHHLAVLHHEAVLHRVVVKLSAGISMSDGDLDGLDIQLLGERDSVVDSLGRLPPQAHDEIAVDHKAKLMAIFGELACTLDGRALLDIFQNLLIA